MENKTSTVNIIPLFDIMDTVSSAFPVKWTTAANPKRME